MNRKLNIILATVFCLATSALSVLCQTSVKPENKTAAPQQVSSSQQSAEYHFPPELLEYFKGDWSGAGKFAKSGRVVESDFSFVADAKNECLIVRQKERAPNTFQYLALWSFDPANNNLVMLSTGNSGAELLRSVSSGWQDGKLVFQSAPELKDPSGFERFTFERKSKDSFTATYEMSSDGQTWRIGDIQTFTRK